MIRVQVRAHSWRHTTVDSISQALHARRYMFAVGSNEIGDDACEPGTECLDPADQRCRVLMMSRTGDAYAPNRDGEPITRVPGSRASRMPQHAPDGSISLRAVAAADSCPDVADAAFLHREARALPQDAEALQLLEARDADVAAGAKWGRGKRVVSRSVFRSPRVYPMALDGARRSREQSSRQHRRECAESS